MYWGMLSIMLLEWFLVGLVFMLLAIMRWSMGWWSSIRADIELYIIRVRTSIMPIINLNLKISIKLIISANPKINIQPTINIPQTINIEEPTLHLISFKSFSNIVTYM